MGFLESLRSAPSTSRAKVNTFLAVFRPDEARVAAFLEGRDDPAFFRPHIETIAAQYAIEIDLYVLGSKADVLEARQYIEARYSTNPRILYFVDKDHDDLITGAGGSSTESTLFVTAGYSIENYLVTGEAIRVALIDFWGLDSTSPAIPVACTRFESALAAFHAGIIRWMAWCVTARRNGLRPSLNNINIRKACSIFDEFEIVFIWPALQSELYAMFAIECDVTSRLTEGDVALVIAELSALPPKVWCRGKAEIAFLVLFLDHMAAQAAPKLRTSIRVGNAVEALAVRLPCPPDLALFLRNWMERVQHSAIVER